MYMFLLSSDVTVPFTARTTLQSTSDRTTPLDAVPAERDGPANDDATAAGDSDVRFRRRVVGAGTDSDGLD